MIYLFDTVVFRMFGNYFPDRFPSFWDNLEKSVNNMEIISVKEVMNEIDIQATKQFVKRWVSEHKKIFFSPTNEEISFIRELFNISHFRQIVGIKQRLQGFPVADPYLIASAKIKGGCIVTEEKEKKNAAKIPNLCKHYSVDCIDLEEFMKRNNWKF